MKPGETDNTLNIFKQPVRQITDLATLERFEKSFVRRELLEFLQVGVLGLILLCQ